MKIYTINARDRKHGEVVLAHRSASFSLHHLELVSLNCSNYDYDFEDSVEDLYECPECGLPLDDHGKSDEIDTLETCIEIDGIGDL